MAEDIQGSSGHQGGNPDSTVSAVENLTDRLSQLLPKIEQLVANPGPGSELMISELRRVGENITGAIKLLDSTMSQVGVGVEESCKRTEAVQNSINVLRYAIWPTLVAILGTIVSVWVTK